MRTVLQNQDFDTAAEFVKALNKERLINPKSWFCYTGEVAGKHVELKSYNTGYLQILRVDGVKHAPPMDMSVTDWRNFIFNAIHEETAQ